MSKNVSITASSLIFSSIMITCMLYVVCYMFMPVPLSLQVEVLLFVEKN